MRGGDDLARSRAPLRPDPHRLARLRFWVVIALAVGLLAALVCLAGPRLLESWVAAKVGRAVQRLPGSVTLGAVTLRDMNTVEVAGATWEDGTDWAVRAGDITIGLEWTAALFKGSPLREVHVQGLEMRLGDPAHPLPGLVEARARLRALVGRRTGGARSARPWPLVSVEGVDAAIHVAGGLAARLTGATIRVGPPEGALDASETRVVLDGEVRLGDEVPRALRAEAVWSAEQGWREGSGSVEPALTWDGPLGVVRVSGLRVRPGEAVVLKPSWAPRGPIAIEAEEVAVRMEPAPGEAGPAPGAGSHPGRARERQWLPEPVGGLLEGHRVTEVVIRRPMIVIALPAPGEPKAQQASDKPVPARTEGAFREALVARYQGLDRAITHVLDMATSLAETMPVDSVRMVGATVRYRRGQEILPESLAHLDASLGLDAATRTLSGRVTFECPEAAFGANEAALSFQPDLRKGRLQVKFRRLPLGPYAGLMPVWLRVSRDSVLADGDFEAQIEPDTLSVEGTIALERVGLFLPAVASVPMDDVSLGLRGRLVVNRAEAWVRAENGLFSFGHVRIPFDFRFERLTSWPRMSLSARIERIRAQDLVESIPGDVIPALKGVRLAGSFAASAALEVDTKDMAGLRADIRPDVADLTILDPGQGVNLDLLRTEFYHRIDEGSGKVIERVVGPSSPSWIALDEVPRFVVDALTTSEDSQFFRHHGFSLSGIRRSLRVNLERGGFYQGASTLSQQLAKNLFLSPEKTFARKLQEAFITWQLERFLSKEKILELYLNVVEWGPEVYGLREAALHYFGKTPAELDPLEVAYLVSILPNPKMFHRHFEAGAVPPAFEARVRSLLRETVRRGFLPEEEFERLQGRRVRFVSPAAPGPVPDEEPATPIPDEEFSDDG